VKVLVTGADGFIGSHLTESLVRQGFEVRAFVQYNSFNSWGWLDHCHEDVKGHFDVISGDIRDPFGVKDSMRDCQAVIHLAALIAIPFSYHSPSAYVATNVMGTLNVLQAARENDVSRVIHTSTSEVYGSARFIPITEEHPLQGQSPYSASKIGADQLAFSFFTSFGLPVVTIRPFNTYGPRQSARAVIPTIITQLASKSRGLNLGSLSPTRDFSFVGDTVSGFMAALESDKGIGEVFNLGSNFEISIGETVDLISNLMNCEPELTLDVNRIRPINSEVNRLLADNSRARNAFGWEPEFRGLEGLKRGLRSTIEWFTDSRNLQRYKPEVYNL